MCYVFHLFCVSLVYPIDVLWRTLKLFGSTPSICQVILGHGSKYLIAVM
jgi:hypothetical protein